MFFLALFFPKKYITPHAAIFSPSAERTRARASHKTAFLFLFTPPVSPTPPHFSRATFFPLHSFQKEIPTLPRMMGILAPLVTVGRSKTLSAPQFPALKNISPPASIFFPSAERTRARASHKTAFLFLFTPPRLSHSATFLPRHVLTARIRLKTKTPASSLYRE